jgi:hypothetical protein
LRFGLETADEIRRVALSYKVFYEKVSVSGSDQYLIDTPLSPTRWMSKDATQAISRQERVGDGWPSR